MSDTVDTHEEIGLLSLELTELYGHLAALDPEPRPVERYVLDPAGQFVAAAVISGGPLHSNPATTAALRCAVRDLRLSGELVAATAG